ncbi:MAG: hypothetical protein F6J87_18360 [Spirulina sp. SIO3F2]|nr:hypothetical protein [Spirulina sp. SIO3F2]
MSKTPTDYFPNLALNGTNLELSLADLAAISEGEVDIATDGGNLPELTFAVVDQYASKSLERGANSQSLPTGQSVTKNAPSAFGADGVNQSYSIQTSSVINYATTDQPA